MKALEDMIQNAIYHVVNEYYEILLLEVTERVYQDIIRYIKKKEGDKDGGKLEERLKKDREFVIREKQKIWEQRIESDQDILKGRENGTDIGED